MTQPNLIHEPSISEILRFAPLGFASRGRVKRSGAIIRGSSSSLGTFEQYEDTQVWTFTGTGFSSGIIASIDGVPYATTLNSNTSFSITVPDALTVGSPLRTASTKIITTNQGGSWNQPVTSWSHGYNASASTFLTGRRLCLIATSADCASATDNTTFTPWTDRSPRAVNGIGQSSNPIFYAAGNGSGWPNHASVYLGAGNYFEVSGDPIHDSSGDWYSIFAMRLGEGFDSSANYTNRYRTSTGGQLDIRRNNNSNRLSVEIFDGSVSNTTTTPVLSDYAYGVLSLRHINNTVGGFSVRWSTSSGLGTTSTNNGIGTLTASLTRYGCLSLFAQDSNMRVAQIIEGNGTISAEREKQAVRECLLTTKLVS